MQFDLSIFNPKARSLIGLDISSSAVKMVELASDGKGGYRVERYSVEILPRDVVADGNIVNLESAAETVRRAWKKLSTSTRLVAVALPASHVITKKIIVAAGQRERARAALDDGARTADGAADRGTAGRAEPVLWFGEQPVGWRTGNVEGVYAHGLLENPGWLLQFVHRCGLRPPSGLDALDVRLDQIAAIVDAHIDLAPFGL